jgi:hypothetical protein
MSRLEYVKVIPKQRTMTSSGKNNPPTDALVFNVFKMSEWQK